MKFIKYLTSLGAILLSPVSASAQQLINLEDPYSNFSNIYTLRPPQYVSAAILMLFGIAGVASFIYLLLGGIQWITAGSDKDALDKARKKILYSLTGLAIVFSAYAILFIIRVLFKVDLIQLTIRPL